MVLLIVRSSRMCFLGSLLMSAVVFSSRWTTVSSPLGSIDLTVMTMLPGSDGISLLRSSRGGRPESTKPYVHWLPSTRGRILAPQAPAVLPVGPLVYSTFFLASAAAVFFWAWAGAAVATGTSRVSGRRAAPGIRTQGSYGTGAPR